MVKYYNEYRNGGEDVGARRAMALSERQKDLRHFHSLCSSELPV
jgi:hypothetical protein